MVCIAGTDLCGMENRPFGYAIPMKAKRNISVSTIRPFDFYVLLFFLVSFAGWLWEVAIYLVTEQTWVNRGIYLGPYLPIYGAGGLLLWFLLHRLHEKKLLTFLLASAVCSAVEYAASVFLEWRWGMRWWDYSGYAINLNGRICLLGAVCFGLGGMFLNCYLMPVYMKLYHKIKPGRRRFLCFILLSVFIVDAAYCAANPNTGRGIAWNQRP